MGVFLSKIFFIINGRRFNRVTILVILTSILIAVLFLTPMTIFAQENVHLNNNNNSQNKGSSSSWPKSNVRPRIDLDGIWSFRKDPNNVGPKERWFDSKTPFNETISVPGSWDAQGVGDATDKVRNSYIGKSWYRRTVKIPSKWLGKEIFLHVGGVHRYADVWINGEHLKRHEGYVTGFEINLTEHILSNEDLTIAIRVDSEQNWEIDALTGAFDMIDYMDVNWGGIYQHVWLEARNDTWIEDVFIKPNTTDSEVDLELTLGGKAKGKQKLLVEVFEPEGKVLGSTAKVLKLSGNHSKIELNLKLINPTLWSPNHPKLYHLKVTLFNGKQESDDWETRFGMIEIEIRDENIYINGKKTYLHGYGDDSVYPKTLCPPADHKEYQERMKLIKQFGFNYVRHHSSVPLPEYFDVADELGILVQPELPIAYERFLESGLDKKAAKKLYLETWKGMIKRYRNHPSVFGWCMSNEMYGGFEFANELYKEAKILDPSRPVYDTDGVPPDLDRPTLDIIPVQFDVHVLPVKSRLNNSIPKRDPMHLLLKPVIERKNKYKFESIPSKPIISHEMGNYVTYPNVFDKDKFIHNIKPFWLEQAYSGLKAMGMLSEAERFSECSENLQALSHKINIETQRMSPYISGHALWLFQDYWTTNVGLVNTYYEIKGKGPKYYSKFIADVVLLADMPAHTFTAGENLEIPFFVSDYGEKEIVNGMLSWALFNGTEKILYGEISNINIKEKGVSQVATIKFLLPPLRNAKKLNFRVTLNSSAGIVKNDWNLWSFPKENDLSTEKDKKIAQIGLDFYSRKYPNIHSISKEEVIPTHTDLILTQSITKPVLDYLKAGGKVILTSAWPLFETELTTYEPAWWLGEPVKDPNSGTVVYNSPALEEFPHEGWCDLQFLDLINNRYVMLLDDIPGANKPIIRAIDSYVGSRHKSFLSEWKVGKGSLLVSTLNLDVNAMILPEAQWLFRSLVRYVAGEKFLPEAELPITYIEKRMGHDTKPPIISSPKFKYYYYEGFWSMTPDYFNITPLDSGYVSKIELKDIKFTDRENYALLFKGYFNIEKSDNYTFYTTSNDGSILSVDNIKVVDNNGSHGTLKKSGSIFLSEGTHYLEVRYFQRGGGKELKVSYEGPNIKRQEIKPIKYN